MSDPATSLTRALRANARKTGVDAEAAVVRSRPWWSATFSGERVVLTLRADDPAAWLAGLPEADLAMRGWFVADLAVGPVRDGVAQVEALVLREA